MQRPDFIIGGATRSGSRKLRSILSAHPHILIPGEPRDQFFQKDMRHVKPLENGAPVAVKPSAQRLLRGEWEANPQRAARYCPNAKIIFTLRNPVSRAYSQFWKAKTEGKEKVPTFEEALNEEMDGRRKPETSRLCWISKNQYQLHLDEWLSEYKSEQVLILIMEEWIDSPESGLAPLEKFLGLEPSSLGRLPEAQPRKRSEPGFFDKLFPRGHQTKMAVRPPMSPDARQALEDIFAPDKLYVANMLDRYEIATWKRDADLAEN